MATRVHVPTKMMDHDSVFPNRNSVRLHHRHRRVIDTTLVRPDDLIINVNRVAVVPGEAYLKVSLFVTVRRVMLMSIYIAIRPNAQRNVMTTVLIILVLIILVMIILVMIMSVVVVVILVMSRMVTGRMMMGNPDMKMRL